MKLLIAFLSFFFVCKAQVRDGYLFEKFINQKELKLMLTEVDNFNNNNFNLTESLTQFTQEEFRIALTMLYLNGNNGFDKLSFRDLTKVYLFSPHLQKKDFILEKIKNYVAGFNISVKDFEEKMPEVEEMIWFFLIIENNNLINFLSNNNLKVQDFIEQIKKSKNFEGFRNIIYSKEDQASKLLWNNKITEAINIITSLKDSEFKNILLARVYFQTQNKKYKEIAKKTIAVGKLEDEGLAFDYIKYLSKTEHYKEALALIGKITINLDTVNSNKFWTLVESLFYHHMSVGEYFEAYELVSKIKITDEKNIKIFTRAKFLSGFVALRFLKEPNIAISYFKAIYDSKNVNVYAKSRGAYFIAQSYKALRNTNLTKSWLTEAGKYVNTFYGILAIEELNNVEPVLFFGSQNYTESKIQDNLKKRDEVHKFYFDELFKSYYKKTSTSGEEDLKMNVAFKVGIIMLYLERVEDASDFFAVSKFEMSLKQIKTAFDLLQDYLIANEVKTTKKFLIHFQAKPQIKGLFWWKATLCLILC